MKVLKHIARIIVGIIFIFSGFVKGIDPLGSAYKFKDYFNAMGMEWMAWSAFSLGVLLAFAEFIIGVSLLFNLKIRLFSWLALFFMVFFTGLTLWIAIANPVTDCGCFGDALVISNWETFYKNLVLIILTIIIFRERKTFKPLLSPKLNLGMGLLIVAVYVGSVYYSYNHLPIIDFRPYHVGVNIPESMSIPEDAPREVYENTFYYKNKKTGEVKEFTEKNYPWKDTVNWAFESNESKLVQKGYEPPIHDFIMETREGDNVADFFLHEENYVFILVAYDLSQTNRDAMDKVNELAHWANDNEMPFIGLTSSLFDESDKFIEETGAPFEFFNCDEITLKTIIRSNPGLLVIKDGVIKGKWHYNDIPTPEKFRKDFLNNFNK
ncbi:MAG: DoxX family protein [Chlorobi bacterium]|nr:DoxX family protein [Chlorobiota bacterium]